MKLTETLFTFTFLVAAFSCTHPDKKPLGNVSVVCVRENDTLFLKIENHTKDSIYIPESYDVDFTVNEDTIYLSGVNKIKYSTDYYYYYKKVFPFPFYSVKQIQGYRPDSVLSNRQQTYYFNQFIATRLISVPKDSFVFQKMSFNIPPYSIAAVTYYTKPFIDNIHTWNVNYSLEDFLRFDSLRGRNVITQVVKRYY